MLDSLDTVIAFSVIMLVVSMLITIAVQMLSAALNLRGKNLAKGLSNTLNTILPGFEKQADEFAKKILSGRLLSDSKNQNVATAARPDEVFDAIHRIATGRRNVPELRDNARNLLVALGVDEAVLNNAANQITQATGMAEQLGQAATEAIAQLPADEQPAIQEALAAVTARLNAYATAGAQQVQQNAAATAQAVDAAYKKFQYWFEAGQERAQQWFTTHVRWFTIGFAVIFAFWFQLDTVDIFKLVSSNRGVRDSLVAQAGVVTKQAEKILVDSPTVLQQALDAWRTGLDDKAKKAIEGEVAAPADSRGSLRKRVQEKLAAAGIQGIDGLIAGFDKTIDKTAQENLKESAKQFSEVKLDLDGKTGFALFPLDGKGRWGDSWCTDFWKHFWGMIFSAALLSLGAPFWFNALKSLSSLRSKVAENISTEKKGDQTPPGAVPDAVQTAAPRPWRLS